jgi:hypothetical protein
MFSIFTQVRSWRIHPFWYALALVFPTLILLTGGALFAAYPHDLPPGWRWIPLPPWQWAVAAFVPPVGEEFGWRAFALPRLQRRTNALCAEPPTSARGGTRAPRSGADCNVQASKTAAIGWPARPAMSYKSGRSHSSMQSKRPASTKHQDCWLMVGHSGQVVCNKRQGALACMIQRVKGCAPRVAPLAGVVRQHRQVGHHHCPFIVMAVRRGRAYGVDGCSGPSYHPLDCTS